MMKSVTLKVDGMSCSHCVNAVEGALKDVNVTGKADLESKTVQVAFDESRINLASIKKAIVDQGYEVR
jgi:copper chaperone